MTYAQLNYLSLLWKLINVLDKIKKKSKSYQKNWLMEPFTFLSHRVFNAFVNPHQDRIISKWSKLISYSMHGVNISLQKNDDK